MSVWVVCPSARPVEEVAKWAAAWRERGYNVAVWRDYGQTAIDIDFVDTGERYPGYAAATNELILQLLDKLDAEWFIAAGDDVFPDPNHTADQIATQCAAHFNQGYVRRFPGLFGDGQSKVVALDTSEALNTFGVMQPTGDRFGEERHSHPLKGAYIDRVAGSAWIGREFAKRVNRGKGPLWPEYFHMGVDEELQQVATRLGVFWQRPDLIHHHQHWSRRERGGPPVKRPNFLARASSAEEWEAYKKLFAAREITGFPGSELI